MAIVALTNATPTGVPETLTAEFADETGATRRLGRDELLLYLQVIATATIAASVSLGGLGRYLIDGLAARDYTQMAGGALLVAGLALLMELVFTLVQKLVVSPGLADQEGR